MDFILDHKLQPWLIEVNLSPACAERTEWLTEMLDNMTDGLLDTIEAKILKIHEDFETDTIKTIKERQTASQNIKRTQNWDLIYDQRVDDPDYRENL